MIERILIAGSGGQGIMLLGKVLVEAAMRESKAVTWIPAYGAEVRGGTSFCMAVISDKPIGSPYVEKADTMFVMNAPSLEKFKTRVATDGLRIINTSLVPGFRKKQKRVIALPFSDIASGLGNIKVANMVALGSFLKAKPLVKVETVFIVMADFAPAARKDLVAINKEALLKGMSAL
jgi:2-oxoglutarate ferredoxin oxidoreductase subunit gamma